MKTAHGILPVPPPATLKLMLGLPTRAAPPGAKGEMVTPTGAALLKALAKFEPIGEGFIPESIGIGAGSKEFPNHPNILRVVIGMLPPQVAKQDIRDTALITEVLTVIEANIDDASPQVNHVIDLWLFL